MGCGDRGTREAFELSRDTEAFRCLDMKGLEVSFLSLGNLEKTQAN